MPIPLKYIISDSEKVSPSVLRDLIEYAIRYFKDEIHQYYNYKDGILEIQVDLPYIYVFGDIHGDFDTLKNILTRIRFDDIVRSSLIIFLGDYIDRGPKQIESITLVLYLLQEYPDRVILLRGNHEPPKWLPVYPHDFPGVLRVNFGREGDEIYRYFMELFQLMPHIAYIRNGLVFLHGGVPVNVLDINEMGWKNRDAFIQILWNDPIDEDGFYPSYRGVGYLFGTDITRRFLEYNGFKGLVRGHEPVDGYRVSQNGCTLTLFTRLGPPYWNSKAGVYRYSVERIFNGFKEEDIILYP